MQILNISVTSRRNITKLGRQLLARYHSNVTPCVQDSPSTSMQTFLSGDSVLWAGLSSCFTGSASIIICNALFFPRISSGIRQWYFHRDMGQLAGKSLPKPEGQLQDLWWEEGRSEEKGVEMLTPGDAWSMPQSYYSSGINLLFSGGLHISFVDRHCLSG